MRDGNGRRHGRYYYHMQHAPGLYVLSTGEEGGRERETWRERGTCSGTLEWQPVEGAAATAEPASPAKSATR